MATVQELLAKSLTELHRIQGGGNLVVRSKDLTDTHRRRLQKAGYLEEVMPGWYVSTSPSAQTGDTTPWFSAFWQFAAAYLGDRFGDEWVCSPEDSLRLHADAAAVPRQLVVYTKAPANKLVSLPHATSIMPVQTPSQLPTGDGLVVRDGLRHYSLPLALTRVGEGFFRSSSKDALIALAGVRDTSEVLRPLLAYGKSVVAGRLAGAFRRAGRPDVADSILSTMRSIHEVRESDPFQATSIPALVLNHATPPIVGRLLLAWSLHRDQVENSFPPAPGLPLDVDGYLADVEAVFVTDAYHSLSIEGYRVTPELIERVRSGSWNPEQSDEDRQNRDALAARGYWQAFQRVKAAVADILRGAPAAEVVRSSYRDWYREMFAPAVAAGTLRADALAGYRNMPVYLRGSRHVPPRWETLPDAMMALLDCLGNEPSPTVRAVLGHWLFGYVHPYPDGNGRMARFLMNAMLASGGYPWTVIRQENRSEYMAALEAASVGDDLEPFARFIATAVNTGQKRSW
ncbi:MAG: Fic family protein [Rhodospirillaceae bacterium]